MMAARLWSAWWASELRWVAHAPESNAVQDLLQHNFRGAANASGGAMKGGSGELFWGFGRHRF